MPTKVLFGSGKFDELHTEKLSGKKGFNCHRQLVINPV